jgi:outer membrane protein assembly factor BamB
MFVSIVVLLLLLCASDQKKVEVTDVALIDRNMLLFSTLNGTLVAVDKTTGDTLWSIKHSKMLKIKHDANLIL